MQLIVEPETTLDIERTMATDDNTQIDKENLETNDFNATKLNGNKQVLENESGCKIQVNSEIKATLANIHSSTDAELSSVDLSKIISEQNNLGDKDVQDESQTNGLENDTDCLISEEKAIIDEPKELSEEDYLEDDIISISEEPYKEILQPETASENVAIDNVSTSVTEAILVEEEDKVEILEDKTKPRQNEGQPSVDNKDIIEVIEETENHLNQVENRLEPQIEKEHEMKHIEQSPVKSEMQLEPSIRKESDEDGTTYEVEDSSVKHDKETNSNDNESVELDVIENDAKFSREVPHQDEIDIIEQVKVIPTEPENKIVLIEEDQIEIIDAEENSNPAENKIESVVDETNNDLTTEDKDEVELIEEPEKDPVLCKNRTDSPTNVTANEIESIENQAMHIGSTPESTKVFQCEPTVEETKTNNVDSSFVLKDDSMEVEGANQCPEINDDPIELNDDMDIEEVHGESISNNKDESEENETSPTNIDPNKIESAKPDCTNTETAVTEPAITGSAKTEAVHTTPISTTPINTTLDKNIICKLSNTLDILSDDEELPEVDLTPRKAVETTEKQCIDIEDDDDIMLIDEDTHKTETNVPIDDKEKSETIADTETDKPLETSEKTVEETNDLFDNNENKESTLSPVPPIEDTPTADIKPKEKTPEPTVESPSPLFRENFVKTAKKKLSDMTRDELEEFCILKIVESIVDRGSLTDIKNKLLSMTHALNENRKKASMLTKQNRDLQVVLKSIQEEQKKVGGTAPITPLKITRSVGMQVYMEKPALRKKGPRQNTNNKNANTPQNKNTNQGQNPRVQKQVNQNIPVPRLVPANNPIQKTSSTLPQINQVNTAGKSNPANGNLKNPSPGMKAEKRPHSKMGSSVTVDLTDDEPPAKMPGGPKTSPVPPVRIVPSQSLMGPQRFGSGVNSPRKVYIPISGPQNQTLRPGQTIMLKTVPPPGLRPRCPTPQVTRVDPNAVRTNRIAPRHPAPLPFAMKQYQPPNWKPLPPAPDLKLSKVENGIVISWKIDDVPEDSYEEIASYQLYAYQETTLPPNTTLWKKIGDVKALPLPMACTLTQFMAGFKYYFAVRAVDIRSRLGPFSLPGSILLLNKSI